MKNSIYIGIFSSTLYVRPKIFSFFGFIRRLGIDRSSVVTYHSNFALVGQCYVYPYEICFLLFLLIFPVIYVIYSTWLLDGSASFPINNGHQFDITNRKKTPQSFSSSMLSSLEAQPLLNITIYFVLCHISNLFLL